MERVPLLGFPAEGILCRVSCASASKIENLR